MDLNRVLKRVDTERMYRHVLKLEGVKHPLDTPDKLNAAADYIYAELQGCGVQARVQEFQIEGFSDAFKNIEGWVGDPGEPAAVIINHYDTVFNDPGANDNAAGVAVMLEAARVLANEKDVPTIRFVSANLEEGNPTFESRIRQSAHSLGLMDERWRYTGYRTAQMIGRYRELLTDAWRAGKTFREAASEAIDQLGDEVPEPIMQHINEYVEVYGDLTKAASVGVTGLMGSGAWVAEAVRIGKKIAFAICLDEIGTTVQEEGSQRLLPGMTYEMLQLYKVEPEKAIGNWAFVAGHGPSDKLAATFCTHCEHDAIDLPYGCAILPMDFDQVAYEMPMALQSDHAPFWRAGIPGIIILDTSSARNPFGHSMADTIDKLDFEHITKICKATIATAVDPSLRV